MKTLLSVFLAVFILVSGGMKVSKRKKYIQAITEVLDFINLVKTEVAYISSDYETIFKKGENRKYKHIVFLNNEIKINGFSDTSEVILFYDFLNRLGKTDSSGQLMLCEEYKDRFEIILKERLEKDKEKIRVDTALSVSAAFVVLVFFLW